MFAIIETGGKQYKAEKGSVLQVEQLEGQAGDTVTIDKVLLLNDGSKTTVGAPTVSGAQVTGKIIEQFRGEKIVVFKMKAKKRYQKTQGHRQNLTKLEITDIKASGAKAALKEEAPKKAATKKAAPKKSEAKKEA